MQNQPRLSLLRESFLPIIRTISGVLAAFALDEGDAGLTALVAIDWSQFPVASAAVLAVYNTCAEEGDALGIRMQPVRSDDFRRMLGLGENWLSLLPEANE